MSEGLKRGISSSGNSAMIRSEVLVDSAWIPVTDGIRSAILVGIGVRSAIEIRRRLFISMARSLLMKKSAPRIGSVTSAM